jgi:D-alanine-D-alanine ligase-like ATP-grasp enzyme
MLNVSRSMPDIAVLRGGNVDFSLSLSEGQEVLQSLSKVGYKPLDVLVDRDGSWTVQGLPTDAHAIFTRAHTVVDTTRDRNAPHIKLAKKMAITLMFSRGTDVHMDREDMYRLLRMQGFKVPDTIVVRAKAPLQPNVFRDVWSTYHTPLMVRPLVRQSGTESKLITMYPEFEKTVKDYHDRGIDVHILTYRKAPTSSLAVLPNFRGEKLYTPLWVETFASTNSIPDPTHQMRAHLHAPEYRKEEMRDIATKVYEALNLSGPACIDVVPYKEGYIVVNVEPHPSLRKDSRFMQSLSSTGANIGEYIHSQIESEFLENSPYKAFGYTRETV